MNPTSPVKNNTTAFTLIELLVVVAIVGVLAGLLLPAVQRTLKAAGETKSAAVLKTVTQASLNFSAENGGIIPALRWAGDPAITGATVQMPPQNRGWVLSSYWACLQPYLFPDITMAPANTGEYANAINERLPKLFGVTKGTFVAPHTLPMMKGSPYEGVLLAGDWSGIRNPLGFNNYVAAWGSVKTIQSVDSAAGTIYAAYGGWGTFDEADGSVYVPMPNNGTKPTTQIHYLPSKRAIASFLDGRVEYVSTPIPAKMFKIDGTE